MNLSFSEMFFIFILALIIFGPKKLPEIGRQIGKALAEFKRYSNDFKYQLESEVRQWEIEETLQKEKETLKEAISVPEGTIPSVGLSTMMEPITIEATAPETTPKAIEPADGEHSIHPPDGSMPNAPVKEPNA